MRILQHSFKSLIRKPVKGIMIFCILILVFGLVFTGIIVQNSVSESKEYVRVKLGATVRILPDYMKAMADEIEDYSIMRPNASLADNLANDERIKGVFLVKNGWSQGVNITSGRENNRDMMDMPEDYEMPAYFDMVGSNMAKPIEFETGNLTLDDGEFFTQEQVDKGDRVVLITHQLAKANNLKVGDTLTILNEQKMYSAEMYDPENPEYQDDFTITGIYSGNGPEQADRLFMPIQVTYDYAWEGEEDLLDNVYLLLHDPMDVDQFIEDNKDKLPNKYMTLDANDDEFKTLTQPLDLLEIITSLLIWVIFGAGALIVLSIVTIFVRDRKFEIGLLLASGESKLKIISQFVFELVIVALIAFIVSAGISQLSSGYVGGWIVENQLMTDEQAEQDEAMEIYSYWDQTKGHVTMTNIAEDFDVSLQLDVVLNLLLISLGILLFAASIPLIIILSYKPREALQD